MNNEYLDDILCRRFDVSLAELHKLPTKELEQLRADLLFGYANKK